MSHGRSIRIYLADGSAAGIRHAEVVNWTGQAVVCPRTRVAELKGWEETQRPGVYLLVGDDPEGTRPLLYVGEAEHVLDRLKQHAADDSKEFWDQVVLFTSKDAHLTKAHVKYLESRIVELAREIERTKLVNGNTPPRPSLPRADRDAMEEFLGPARLLLAALGFTALQPLARRLADSAVGPSGPFAHIELRLVVPKRQTDARGYQTDEGFVVLAGSKGDATVRESLHKGWRTRREELLADGSIRTTATGIEFARDVLFTSSSAASSVTLGGRWGGPDGWRTADGTTLGALEAGLGSAPSDGRSGAS
jgi:hypothetical protein